MKYFQAQGWLVITGDYIKFNKLSGADLRHYRLFTSNTEQIAAATNPAIYYCDLIKRDILHYRFYCQAGSDLDRNCSDRNVRRKILSTVRQGKTPLGSRQGINCSISTVGAIFRKARITAFRYIKGMRESGVIQTFQNSVRVCGLEEWDIVRANTDLYNRCFVSGGSVFERLTLSYLFRP
jgi:hypothetical protein